MLTQTYFEMFMKNLFFGCILLITLPCSEIRANQETKDNLTPLYNTITETVLPGISAFIDVLVEKDSNDLSDYGLISRAQCAYLSWVLQRNQKLHLNQDKNNDIRLESEDNDRQESIIAEYCHHRLGIIDHRLPDISTLNLSSPKRPYFPIGRFIAAEKASFSPLSSFVQKTPSYKALSMVEHAASNMHKKRIILETILFLLGRITQDHPDDSWSQLFTYNFREAMRPFHCSRFIKAGDPDLTPFSDCLQKQSDSDVQRSNHARILTDIALGEFSPVVDSLDSFDSYGYQPGFAFAGSYTGKSPLSGKSPLYRMTSSISVIAETMVLAFLMRHISGY